MARRSRNWNRSVRPLFSSFHGLAHRAIKDRVESIDRVSLALLVADDRLADLRRLRERTLDRAAQRLPFNEESLACLARRDPNAVVSKVDACKT